jgi:hypothetical protein
MWEVPQGAESGGAASTLGLPPDWKTLMCAGLQALRF